MKRWILGVTALCLTFGVAGSAIAAEEVFRIEMGKSKSASERELRQRVEMLERAVEQLQRKVFDLQRTPEYREPEYHRPIFSKMTTCYLKTPFDGTFMATEPTETAARARTLTKCNDKLNGGSIFCKESEIKCGQ
jgi:hypothetical protein